MAGKNGATSVTFLDASKQALELAARNLAANAPDTTGETLAGDALTELAALRDAGRRFRRGVS